MRGSIPLSSAMNKRKNKWIANKKKEVNPNSTLGRFQHLIDWDQAYRTRNKFKRRVWLQNTFRWLLDIKFYIQLKIVIWKRKRKNTKNKSM